MDKRVEFRINMGVVLEVYPKEGGSTSGHWPFDESICEWSLRGLHQPLARETFVHSAPSYQAPPAYDSGGGDVGAVFAPLV